MRPVLILAALVLLGACSKPSHREYSDDLSDDMSDRAPPALIRPSGGAQPRTRTAASAEAKGAAISPAAVGGPMMAYSYFYALTASPKAVPGLMESHEQACLAAGLQACQVVASNMSEKGEDRVSARLAVRATPAWLESFRDGLEGQAKAAGGRIVSASIKSDDLSRQIVDTEAALRAKSTLRDRLQALLASRPGKLSDLLEVERELARVQEEIDATQSQLAMMRARVSMSQLNLTYESGGVLAPEGVFSPLARAVADFVGILVLGVAGIITIVAWTAPWALLAGALAWFLRKRVFRGGGRRNRPAAEASIQGEPPSPPG